MRSTVKSVFLFACHEEYKPKYIKSLVNAILSTTISYHNFFKWFKPHAYIVSIPYSGLFSRGKFFMNMVTF